MRSQWGAFSALVIGVATIAAPSLADSVAVTTGPNGTVVVNGKPCRVVTGHDRNAENQPNSNSTSITVGPNGLSGSTSTTVTPGGYSASVTVGSGSSSNGAQSSSAAGSDCVIYRGAADK